MKNIAHILIATAAASFVALSVSAQQEVPEDRIKVRMGYADFAPFSYNKDNKEHGVVVDLVKRAAAHEGLDLTWHHRPVTRLFSEVARGSLDVYMGLATVKQARGKVYYREHPVLTTDMRLWALKETPLADIDTLTQEPIILKRDFTYAGFINVLRRREQKMVFVDTHRKLFTALGAGRAKYGLNYLGPAQRNVPAALLAQFHSRSVQKIDAYFNVSKKHPRGEEILDRFYRGLEKLEEHRAQYHGDQE